MSSKTSQRGKVEESPEASIDPESRGSPGWVKPGDQVLFSIPHGPGDITREIWGYILEKPSKVPDTSFVVIDEPFILNQAANVRNGQTVVVKHSDIIGLIERIDHKNSPVIHVSMHDGIVVSLRRVDGKTSPIMVVIDEGDMSHSYMVDHQSHKPV
jgi:hypothetical protein